MSERPPDAPAEDVTQTKAEKKILVVSLPRTLRTICRCVILYEVKVLGLVSYTQTVFAVQAVQAVSARCEAALRRSV